MSLSGINSAATRLEFDFAKNPQSLLDSIAKRFVFAVFKSIRCRFQMCCVESRFMMCCCQIMVARDVPFCRAHETYP